MKEYNLPIFKKVYDLYKAIHSLRNTLPKQDRHTVWQRTEQSNLHLIETIFRAASRTKDEKIPLLDEASVQLNLLRLHIRLAYDTKGINNGKYVTLQERIDEIGRMLGGWLKSLRSA